MQMTCSSCEVYGQCWQLAGMALEDLVVSGLLASDWDHECLLLLDVDVTLMKDRLLLGKLEMVLVKGPQKGTLV